MRPLLTVFPGMTTQYACVFGISSGIRGLNTGGQVLHINSGWTLVAIPSKEGEVFWFIVKKLDQEYRYSNAPRFTSEDAAAECLHLADVPMWENLRFGDLWQKRRNFNMTVMHENVFQTWYCDRLVCIGDSIHKVGQPLLFALISLSTHHSLPDDYQPWTRSQLCH